MSRDDMPEIKPCPFCGEDYPSIVKDECVTSRLLVKVNCCNCEAQGPFEWSKETAIEKWNTVSEVYFRHEPR